MFEVSQLEWTREPKLWRIFDDGSIEIVTEPGTDLWQRTYYHFRNDSAPALQLTTDERFFSFVVRTDFSGAQHRFDQCGVVLYLDSDNWIKGSVEYEDGIIQHLGSVVTNHGFSDWATTEIPADVRTMWYRLSRREDDYRIDCSDDGVAWRQMRVCHLHEGRDTIRVGIYACSPENSSYTARFDCLDMGACVWAAHDGQQPDESAIRIHNLLRYDADDAKREGSIMTNKEIVAKFYDEVFNAWDTSKLDEYMLPTYRQHNPTVEDGREGFARFCERFFSVHPKMEIVHMVEEGDMVMVFFKCTVDVGINKVCDIYRLEDGMLAEHWDVVQHLDPDQVPANDNGQF